MGQHRLIRGACTALLLCMVTLGAIADEKGGAGRGYYEAKEEGWFWREIIPVPVGPLDRTGATAAPIPEFVPEPAEEPAGLTPLSPAWLREKLPEFRDRALEDPSPENVRAYFYLQRYAMDIAQRFALVAQQVVLTDPALDENTRRPISTYGGQVFDDVARENRLVVAAKVAAQAGVWYFYRSDCPYCRAQNPVLERLQKRIGLAVLPIALDGQAMPERAFARFVADHGHAQQLGVTQTPTLYLVRKPNQFVLLSEGLVTDDGLLERIVFAGHDAGWISDEEFHSTRAAKPPVMAPIDTVTAEALADPAKIIEALRQREPLGAASIALSER